MGKTLVCLILLFSLASGLLAQEAPPAAEKIDPDVEKQAVDLLRDTAVDVGNLRLRENRISFNSELASLMWFHDEKQARAMYESVVREFADLLVQYDAEMNAPAVPDGGDLSAGLVDSIAQRSSAARKMQTAIGVRQQIASGMAEHDADLALNFYRESVAAITSPEIRRQIGMQDEYFESKLIGIIASNDPEKAAKLSGASLSNGLSSQHVAILKALYRKDPEKSVDFAAAVLKAAKAVQKSYSDTYILYSLLSFGSETIEASLKDPKQKPVYTRDQMKELAEAVAKSVIQGFDVFSADHYADEIAKYAPASAAEVREAARKKIEEYQRTARSGAMSNSANAISNAMTAANFAMANAANQITKEADSRAKAEKDFNDGMAKMASPTLANEERRKMADQARKAIYRMPGRAQRLASICTLAAQVARSGDKELAADLMNEARAAVNLQPKSYEEYMLAWALVAGYAEADPEKAFPLMGDLISRANETIAAFVKVGEFIDVRGEMINEGEIEVGAFGGDMLRGMTQELGIASGPIKDLAKSDFKRTRDLANSFDRPEVRILAKMLILRSVLDAKSKPTNFSYDMRDIAID